MVFITTTAEPLSAFLTIISFLTLVGQFVIFLLLLDFGVSSGFK